MANFKKQLLAVLREIKGSGTFLSKGVKPFLFPGIQVKGVGEISFPVNATEVAKMIQQARKTPFGKGSETVLDTSVRSAWEIDPDKITFTNSDWNKFIIRAVEQVKPDLGIEGCSVSAHLYKLLVYEKGDFFLPHKDSEKEPGMFGTLVVYLPSKYEGGELVLSFDGTTHVIDFSGPEKQYQIPFVAFYADCEHEIKPICSGHRVCLVYNLVQKKDEEKIQLQQLGNYTNRLAAILKTAEEEQDIPKIVLLGHQYTPSNFTMAALKLNDRPKSEALLLAAERAGFYAKLGLITSYQMGELVVDYDNRQHRSRQRRWYGYDNDFCDEELAENGSMGEVYDGYLEVEHWMPEGVPPLRNLPFEEEDLISETKLHEGEPAEKEATEYTGNAGMEMQYWYHYGAVFLWPRKYHYDMLIDLRADNKLEWIAYYNRRWDKLEAADIALIKRLAEAGFGQDHDKEELNCDPLAEWLVKLNDEKYLAGEAAGLLTDHFSEISTGSWMKLIEKYGTGPFEKIFAVAGEMGKKNVLKHLLIILNHLASAGNYSTFVMTQLRQIPAYLLTVNLAETRGKETAKDILLETLNVSRLKSTDKPWLQKTAGIFTRELNRTFVNDVLVAGILTSGKRSILGDLILEICIKDLKNRVDHKPQPPVDWSRPVPTNNGYDRNVWPILRPFLQSPTQRVFDYQKAQAYRSEMERAIKSVTIDLRTETIRKGSPHTLRVKKTQSAYEKELSKWEKDVALLKKAEHSLKTNYDKDGHG